MIQYGSVMGSAGAYSISGTHMVKAKTGNKPCRVGSSWSVQIKLFRERRINGTLIVQFIKMSIITIQEVNQEVEVKSDGSYVWRLCYWYMN